MANNLVETNQRLIKLREEKKVLTEETLNLLNAAEKEGRDFTAAEQEKWDELGKKAGELQSRIENHENIAVQLSSNGLVKNPDDLYAATPEEKVGIAKAAFPTPFKSFGEQLAVIARAGLTGEADPRLFQTAAAGGSEAVDSDGGFLVQQDFSSELLRLVHEQGQIWSRVRKIPVSGLSNGLKINAVDESSRVAGSRWGGIQAYWAAEADTPTAKKPKFRQMNLELKKIIGLAYMTDELLQDTTALGAILTEAFTEEFIFMAEKAVIEGTGAGEPLGIEKVAAVLAVAKETGQPAKTIVYENIVNMLARLWVRSMNNAVWPINQDILPQLMTMSIGVGTAGQPVFLPPGGASASPYGTLMGRPIVPIEHAETLGTQGDISLMDFSQYLVIEKGPIQSATSIHVKFESAQTAFRLTWRIDGQPIWNKALTPAKGSNTVSPFVQLAVRA